MNKTFFPVFVLGALALLAPFHFLSASPFTGSDWGAGTGSPRILMMIGDGFNGNEFWEPYFAFTAAGYQVEVASYEIRPISCGNRGDVNTDFTPHLTLDEVDPSSYAAFFLPGGKGPEALEKYPESIEICRGFDRAGILISSLCHGPRLLGQAGVMKGKMTTYLAKVRDEIPDHFEKGDLGYYQDLPLVRDRNLFTSRYPNDVGVLTRATLERLGESYPDRWPSGEPSVLLVHGRLNKLETYAYRLAGLTAHARVTSVPAERIDGWLKEEAPPSGDFDMLVVIGGKDPESFSREQAGLIGTYWDDTRPVLASGSLRRAFRRSLDQIVWLEGTLEEDHARVVKRAYREAGQTRKKETPSYDAYLAVEPDFDETAFQAARTILQTEGFRVAVISSGNGPVRSMNGLLAGVDLTYDQAGQLADRTIVVDPGGIWPYEEPLEPFEKEHFDWVYRQWKEGARVLAVGFGSYYLCSREEFRGMKAATTDQGEWSFGKRGGASYSPAPAVITTGRLITVKSASHILEGFRLFFTPAD